MRWASREARGGARWTPRRSPSRRRTPTTEASGGSGAKPSPKPSSRRDVRRDGGGAGGGKSSSARTPRGGSDRRGGGVAFARRGRPGSVSRRAVVVPPGPPPSSAFRASRGRARRVASPRPRRRLRVGRRARPRGDAVAASASPPTSARATRKSPTSWRRSRARFGTDAGSSATGATRGFCRWRSSFERRSSGSGLDPRRRRVRTRRSPRTRVGDRRFDRRRVGGDARRAVRDALEPLQHDVLRRRRERSVPPRRRSRRRRLPRGRVCVPGGGARVAFAPGACLRAVRSEAPPRRSGADELDPRTRRDRERAVAEAVARNEWPEPNAPESRHVRAAIESALRARIPRGDVALGGPDATAWTRSTPRVKAKEREPPAETERSGGTSPKPSRAGSRRRFCFRRRTARSRSTRGTRASRGWRRFLLRAF